MAASKHSRICKYTTAVGTAFLFNEPILPNTANVLSEFFAWPTKQPRYMCSEAIGCHAKHDHVSLTVEKVVVIVRSKLLPRSPKL